MGRKSKAKDRAYLTRTEWQTEGGGYKDKSHGVFKQLPFFCCAISLQPFEDPMCTSDGIVYDIEHVVPYIRKFHRHPVLGEPLELKDLIKLNFHKNAEGQYHCPVLHKVFTEHTHIAAVKTTGHVYSFEALQELNIKSKNWKDLLTDAAFSRKDIIHIQDPLNLAGRNLEAFDHIKKDLRVVDDEELARQQQDPMHSLKNLSDDAKRALGKLGTEEAAMVGIGAAEGRTMRDGPDPRLQPPKQENAAAKANFKPGAATWNTDDPKQAPPGQRPEDRKKKPSAAAVAAEKAAAEKKAGEKQAPQPYLTDAKYTTDDFRTSGAAARSFTSTAVNVVTQNTRARVRVERKPKKKGYMRLHTSLGDLNVELHCDIVPRTCENFFVLAESGYYSNTIFHRSIRNFMIQGGDPTGTGTGGESIYGPTFKDELDSRLLHSGRGVLSMANSGKDTNGSQFFILYKSAHHLDYKHTVFGKVVGGFEVLTAMEKVTVGDEDRPNQPISITGATVFVNPFKDEEEEERKAAEKAQKEKERSAAPLAGDDLVGSWYSNPGGGASGSGRHQAEDGAGPTPPTPLANGLRVGKYLPTSAVASKAAAAAAAGAPEQRAANELSQTNGAAGSNGPGPPPAKKQKQQGYGNFDAW
ncbi:hypothetical protein WJX74_002655 [Apatococcus lobatus]|uniref:RING-type E3 ubiquitin transferase n=1 Tax=Apatococcus lobatus TaxID=904363 RepID=A0AAW1RKQ8_9CHLO